MAVKPVMIFQYLIYAAIRVLCYKDSMGKGEISGTIVCGRKCNDVEALQPSIAVGQEECGVLNACISA